MPCKLIRWARKRKATPPIGDDGDPAVADKAVDITSVKTYNANIEGVADKRFSPS